MTGNMFNTNFGLPSFISNFFRPSTTHPIVLPSVEIHQIETNTDKAPRTLKHLLRANHMNYSIIYNNLRFHNHLPHLLCSSYIFGATREQLQLIYESESEHLEPWEDSPGEITKQDWRRYLGKREYQRAFIDFFEDRMVEYHYDWRHLVQEILFSGPNPLIHAAVSGLGHPLIHLGYAMEFDNREVAIEALSLIACFYSDIHKYLDDPQWTRPDRRPPWTSTSLFEILDRVRSDRRFDDLFDQPGADNVTRLFREKEPELMEWWNAWDLSPEGSPDVSARFEESQRLATALLVGSVDAEKGRGYDFFLVHTLTTSHAVRILLPLIPPEFQLSLVKEWWLFILAVFIAQLRPAIDTNRIKRFDLGNQSWTNVVVPRALQGEFRTDPHFVKGCRAMKEAAATWGDEDRYFEKAAVLFATEFTGWGGFTATGSRHAEEIPDI